MNKILLVMMLVGFQSYAGDLTKAAGSSFADQSCEMPLGAMVQACKDLADAFKSTCVQNYFNKFHAEAKSGELKDAGDFCENSSAVRDEVAFQNVLINFFGSLVAHECSGKANAKNTESPNGTAIGYFQMDAKSANGYECCKGTINSSADLENGEKAAICGVGMSLQNMSKDSCWAMGGGGDATSFGAAKYNQPLRAVAAADKKHKEEIEQATKSACASPSSTPMPGNGSPGVMAFLQQRAPASQFVCEN